MAKVLEPAVVRVESPGRRTIPSLLRRWLLGIDPGDTLITRLENGRIVFEKPEAIKRRIQERFQLTPPAAGLADELIAKRRARVRSSLDDGVA